MRTPYKPWVNIPQHGLVAVPVVPVRKRPPLLRTSLLGEFDPLSRMSATDRIMLSFSGVILVAVAYHGYKRHADSVPWGLGWAVGGLICPTVTLAFALSQGFAKKR